FFSSRRRHTSFSRDWSSDVCSSDLALDGKLGTTLADLLRPKGIEVLAWWENGFRNITNNKHPIVKPADLAGIKIRVTPDKVRLEIGSASCREIVWHPGAPWAPQQTT